MPRNKYPEETRNRILDAAIKLFNAKGFEDVTVLDIIADTGDLTRGAFYHHFKSKDDVLDAIFKRHWETNGDPWKPVISRTDLNGLEKVKLLIKTGVTANLTDETNKAITNLALNALHSPRFFMEHHKGNLLQATFFEPVVAEGMADGSIPPGNAKAISELMFLLVNVWMLPNIYPGTFEEIWARAEIVERIFDMLGLPILDDDIGKAFAETIGFLEEAQEIIP